MAGYETLSVYAGKAQDKCLRVSLLLHSVGHDRKWDLGEGKEARVKHNALFLSLIDKSPFQPLDISDTRMSISRAPHGLAYSLPKGTVCSLFWRISGEKTFSQFDSLHVCSKNHKQQ